MNNMSVVGMMNAIVPITRFNKGEATKIFDEVEHYGTKIVVKNNKPACVLISPSQYENLMEMLSDYMLHTEAELRMENNNPEENMTHDDMMKELGITREELDAVDVDIE
jgi:antitoxin StbD